MKFTKTAMYIGVGVLAIGAYMWYKKNKSKSQGSGQLAMGKPATKMTQAEVEKSKQQLASGGKNINLQSFKDSLQNR
jgi:uncharacterized membrane protein YebE (DUF533 family)